MPLRTITIVDGDHVEAANLERQELYAPVDVGRAKAGVAAAWLRQAPVDVAVVANEVFIDAANAEHLISAHDLVIDCTDDLHARRLIDQHCKRAGVPLIACAVHGRDGQVILLHAPGAAADLSLPEIFAGRPGGEQDGCDMRLVPLATLHEVARRAAQHVRQYTRGADWNNGDLEVFDGEARNWLVVHAQQGA